MSVFLSLDNAYKDINSDSDFVMKKSHSKAFKTLMGSLVVPKEEPLNIVSQLGTVPSRTLSTHIYPMNI